MFDVRISDEQLKQIITAIESLKGGGIHWEQVVPVFLSALLAMLVGVLLEFFKSKREKTRLETERYKRERQQINAAVVGIAYNVETLLHTAGQHLLPHRDDSTTAYRELQDAKDDREKVRAFALSLHRFPALMMTCPQIDFEEIAFLERVPFLVEKDPELVKNAGWLTSFSRQLNCAIASRNEQIQSALAKTQAGDLKFHQLDQIIHLQMSIALAECLNALQLLDMLVSTAEKLHGISTVYKVPGKSSKLILPPHFEPIMNQLHVIARENNSLSPFPASSLS